MCDGIHIIVYHDDSSIFEEIRQHDTCIGLSDAQTFCNCEKPTRITIRK